MEEVVEEIADFSNGVTDDCVALKTHKAKGRGKRSTVKGHPLSSVIVKILENPKRKASLAAIRYDNYKVGMTLQQALDAGVTRGDICWDLTKGFIAVE